MVTGIIYEGDKPAGVTWESGSERNKSANADHAAEIVVNAAVPNLAGNMLPKGRGNILSEKIENMNIGASLLTVYFGFRKSLKETGNRHYSTFVFDPSVKTQKDIVKNNKAGFETRSFTFVDYSQVDSALAPDGKGVGAVCCIDYIRDWEGMERNTYLKRKTAVADIFIDRCEKLIPGFSNALEYVEVATPLTVKRYTMNPAGAVYGFAQNPGKPSAYLSALPDNLHIEAPSTAGI